MSSASQPPITLGMMVGQITTHAQDRGMWHAAFYAAEQRGVRLQLIEDWRLATTLNSWVYRQVNGMVDGLLVPLYRLNENEQYSNDQLLASWSNLPIVTLDLHESEHANFVSDPTEALKKMVARLVIDYGRSNPMVMLSDRRKQMTQQYKGWVEKAFLSHGITLQADQWILTSSYQGLEDREALIRRRFIETDQPVDALLSWSQVDFDKRYRQLFRKLGVLVPEDVSVFCLLDHKGHMEHDPMPSYLTHNVNACIPEAMDLLIQQIQSKQQGHQKKSVTHIPARLIERGTSNPGTELMRLQQKVEEPEWIISQTEMEQLGPVLLDELSQDAYQTRLPSRLGIEGFISESFQRLARRDALGFSRSFERFCSLYQGKPEVCLIGVLNQMDRFLEARVETDHYQWIHALLAHWEKQVHRQLAKVAQYLQNHELFREDKLRNQVMKVKFSESDGDYARVAKVIDQLWIDDWMCMLSCPDQPAMVYPLIVASGGEVVVLKDEKQRFPVKSPPPWEAFGLQNPQFSAMRSYDLGIDMGLSEIRGYLCCTITPMMREGLQHIHRLLTALQVVLEQHDEVLLQREKLASLNQQLHKEVAQRKHAEKELEFLAMHDSLTGLANRVLLREHLQLAMNQFRRGNHQFALVYIDLDKFKPVNDTYGHHIGDLLLKKFAQLLNACVRETDTVARIGGDEFAIVVRDASQVSTIIERIQSALRRPIPCEHLMLQVEASFGYVMGMRAEQSIEELMKYADQRMYEMKMKKPK